MFLIGITWSAGTLSILVNRLLFGLHTETESYLLVVVCLACWGYSLFFCMGFEKTGPTVVMSACLSSDHLHMQHSYAS
eukprot:SAG31_NODE_1863_length_7037_cov_2.325742_5_plen_78_part_00